MLLNPGQEADTVHANMKNDRAQRTSGACLRVSGLEHQFWQVDGQSPARRLRCARHLTCIARYSYQDLLLVQDRENGIQLESIEIVEKRVGQGVFDPPSPGGEKKVENSETFSRGWKKARFFDPHPEWREIQICRTLEPRS